MNEHFEYFVGVDWGSENHRIVVLNHEGRVTEHYDAAHSGRGLEARVVGSRCGDTH